MAIHSVILAGGEGKRFWPLSTIEKPKQFLNFLDKNTLLQNTLSRVLDSDLFDKHWIVTQKKYEHFVFEQIPFLDVKNVLSEPVPKNTLASIAYAVYHIESEDPEAHLVVLPSDHFVGNPSVFLDHLSVCIQHLHLNSQEIIILGVQPDFPNTQYGYIQSEKNTITDLQKVLAFKEKPDLQTAEFFLKTGKYFWNTGIFLFKAKTLIEYIQKKYPKLDAVFQKNENWQTRFENLESLSFDHGVMENYPYISVLPSVFTWSDLGTWESIYQYSPKDEYKNVIQGAVLIENVQDCLIINHQKTPIQLKNLQNLCCIFTDENTLIQKRQL